MDEKIKILTVDGQKLMCPTKEQWEVIFSSSEVNGISIPLIYLIKEKVNRNFNYKELKSCLRICNNRFAFYELLLINNELIRVFVESIICEKCSERATISATPGVVDIYFGLTDEKKTRKKGYRYPNLKCKYCGAVYERRYTIWQIYNN